jgi:hypothetical protein
LFAVDDNSGLLLAASYTTVDDGALIWSMSLFLAINMPLTQLRTRREIFGRNVLAMLSSTFFPE